MLQPLPLLPTAHINNATATAPTAHTNNATATAPTLQLPPMQLLQLLCAGEYRTTGVYNIFIFRSGVW